MSFQLIFLSLCSWVILICCQRVTSGVGVVSAGTSCGCSSAAVSSPSCKGSCPGCIGGWGPGFWGVTWTPVAAVGWRKGFSPGWWGCRDGCDGRGGGCTGKEYSYCREIWKECQKEMVHWTMVPRISTAKCLDVCCLEGSSVEAGGGGSALGKVLSVLTPLALMGPLFLGAQKSMCLNFLVEWLIFLLWVSTTICISLFHHFLTRL